MLDFFKTFSKSLKHLWAAVTCLSLCWAGTKRYISSRQGAFHPFHEDVQVREWLMTLYAIHLHLAASTTIKYSCLFDFSFKSTTPIESCTLVKTESKVERTCYELYISRTLYSHGFLLYIYLFHPLVLDCIHVTSGVMWLYECVMWLTQSPDLNKLWCNCCCHGVVQS